MEAVKEGYYLGAGSPAHPDGDSAKSDTGIVQGHAYSVLKAIEVDGIKLVQIRNPWGRGEWTGDWSDDSDLWTTRMRNVLNWNLIEDDGIFWMEFGDFLSEFDEIYIGRNLTESKGWKNISVIDAWKGKYAGGLPSKQNKGAKMTEAPQFAITINKPGKGFLVMRLKEKKNTAEAV